jgi:hypothetical protein
MVDFKVMIHPESTNSILHPAHELCATTLTATKQNQFQQHNLVKQPSNANSRAFLTLAMNSATALMTPHTVQSSRAMSTQEHGRVKDWVAESIITPSSIQAV